jgi:hypothetical protein
VIGLDVEYGLNVLVVEHDVIDLVEQVDALALQPVVIAEDGQYNHQGEIDLHGELEVNYLLCVAEHDELCVADQAMFAEE